MRRGLLPLIAGRRIVALRWSGKNLRTLVPEVLLQQRLPGSVITDIGRRAKYLLFTTSHRDLLIVHLGMTGRFGLFPEHTPPAVHDHLFFRLDNDMELRFNDTRRFGSVHLITSEKMDEALPYFFRATGPEPFAEECTPSYLHRLARGKSQAVKSFIMDSRIIAGVGNIYANESLFAAGIHPQTPAGRLSKKKWGKLLENIRRILNWAIDCGGSTISDFLGAGGQKGYFQIQFKVYGRHHEPCFNCKTLLLKSVVGGRASFYCPHCQRKR